MNRRYDYPGQQGGQGGTQSERYGQQDGSPDEYRGGGPRYAGEREFGGRSEGQYGSQRESGRYGGGELSEQDYSNRYSTSAGRGGWDDNAYERGGYGQVPGETRHSGGAGYGRSNNEGRGRFGGSESDINRGYAAGGYGSGYQGNYQSGRQWQGGYGEYESEGDLARMGGGADMLPRSEGGGRYTSRGYGGGYGEREFGAGYGSSSGYQASPGYRGDYGGFSGGGQGSGSQGRNFGGGSMQGGQQFGNQNHGQNYGGRGEGGGAFGSGYPGEHLDDWNQGQRYAQRGYSSGSYGGQSGMSGRGDYGQQQGFSGRGPKGYTRSDERLKEDICERLTDDPHIDAADIDIEVSKGVVTLSGSVSDRWMKYHAEDLIDRCAGVKDITNNLSAKRQDESRNQPGSSSLGGSGSSTSVAGKDGGSRSTGSTGATGTSTGTH